MVVGSSGFVSSSGRSGFSGCADCTGASTLLGLKSRGAGSSVMGSVESTKPYAGLLGFSKSIAALFAASSFAFASAAASSLLNAFSLAALIFPGVPIAISAMPSGPSATASKAISPGVNVSRNPKAISDAWPAVSPAAPRPICMPVSATERPAIFIPLLPAWTPPATSLPARPIDRASNTAIGTPYVVPRFLALAQNSLSDISSMMAASLFISTPVERISSVITLAYVVPNVIEPATAAPVTGVPTAEPVINAASDGAETTRLSPTTDNVACGFFAIALRESIKPSASTISCSPFCISGGASGYSLSSSIILRTNSSGDFRPNSWPSTLNAWFKRPRPRMKALFGISNVLPFAIILAAVLSSIGTSPIGVMSV